MTDIVNKPIGFNIIALALAITFACAGSMTGVFSHSLSANQMDLLNLTHPELAKFRAKKKKRNGPNEPDRGSGSEKSISPVDRDTLRRIR